MPPQGDHVPTRGEGNEVLLVPLDTTNGEIREAFLALARPMTTHVNRGIEPRENAMESTMSSWLKDFVRINPPIFHGSKVGEDPQQFLDCLYKVLVSWVLLL